MAIRNQAHIDGNHQALEENQDMPDNYLHNIDTYISNTNVNQD